MKASSGSGEWPIRMRRTSVVLTGMSSRRSSRRGGDYRMPARKGTSMADDLKRRVEDLSGPLVAWRRALHKKPELGFEEHETAALVGQQLRELGIEVKTGVAKTGVVGVLRAAQPSRPPVLLRADMDALPIDEVAGRPYGSEVAGKMHACGHDGHMAMLLGAASVLT